ncbi:MAG TPA: type II secretion system F family protein [bacterium]|nr:type II secretion system F family protein [bacterium]
MPNYNFIAQDHLGRNYRGTLFGATEQAVFFKLQKLGYLVISVTEKEEKRVSELITPNITLADIVIFTRLFSTVIKTGVPALDALAAIEEQTENPAFRRVIRKVREDVEHGSSLSTAFEQHPKVFPHLFIAMVQSGELSGNLTDVLDRLSIYLERDIDLRRSISQAFIYPKLVGVIAAGAIIFVMMKVIPVFAKVYGETKFKLPRPTEILMDISKFMTSHKELVAIFCAVVVFGYLYLKTTASGRKYYDAFMSKLPVIGPINKRIVVSRVVRSLGSMLACGVPLLSSLEAVKAVAGNVDFERDLDRIIESVEAGGTISTPMRMSSNFPPVVTYMVAAGEQSGRLPDLLDKCSEAIEKELQYLIKKFLILLEPMLTIFVAMIVAFVAVAIYLPIFYFITQAPK